MNATEIGVISDTHGLLRPEALAQLRGSHLILHAGDIGARGVLDELGRIARVVAVRGNNDRAEWARDIPERQLIDVGGVSICMVHDASDLEGHPSHEPHGLVVTGHSHRAHIERRNGVLYVNPGSAGPRRFRLPVTIARVCIEHAAMDARIVTLLP